MRMHDRISKYAAEFAVSRSPSSTIEGIQTIKSNRPSCIDLPRMMLRYDSKLTTTSTVGLAQIAKAILAGLLGCPEARATTPHSHTPAEARSMKASQH